MTNTFLGYEVASAQQQRKTALIVLAVAPLAIIGLVAALYAWTHFKQTGRQQAMATITQEVTKCRYIVRRVSKRARYDDKTGFIGCAEARAIEAEQDNFLGSVDERTFARVSFVTRDGLDTTADIELSGQRQYKVGDSFEILYDTNDPSRITEFGKDALGFGMQSIAPEKEAAGDTGASAAAPDRKPRWSDSLSDTNRMWIGIGGLVAIIMFALWLLWAIYRVIRRLIGGPKQASPVAGDPMARLGQTMPAQHPAPAAPAPAPTGGYRPAPGPRAQFGQR